MGRKTNDGCDEPHGVVAVGASAGGVEALTQLASGLPTDLPFAVLVVLHMPPDAPSALARIVNRSGPLPAVAASDGAQLQPGQIYVGLPNRHLVVQDSRVVLSEGPTENGHRPAINALFRSAALEYGPRAIGVLLSGVHGDGNFRCHVGHAWTGESLQARDEEIEGALWVAVRSLQEKSKLARRMADNSRSETLHDRYIALAVEAEQALAILGKRLSETYSDSKERGAG
jgi:hypothetical protein